MFGSPACKTRNTCNHVEGREVGESLQQPVVISIERELQSESARERERGQVRSKPRVETHGHERPLNRFADVA